MLLRLLLAATGGAAFATVTNGLAPVANVLSGIGPLGAIEGTKDKLQLELTYLRNDINSLLSRPMYVSAVPIQSNRMSIITQGLVMVGVGFLGYMGMKAFGLSLADLFYVSGRTFRNTVSNLAAGMQLLGQRVSGLSHGVQGLKADIEGGFGKLDGDVGRVKHQVEELGTSLDRVESSVERVESKVEHTRQGIYALCSVISESLRGLPQTDARRALGDFTLGSTHHQHQPQLHATQIHQLLETVASSTANASPAYSETQPSPLLARNLYGEGRPSMSQRAPQLQREMPGEEEEDEERWTQKFTATLSGFLRPPK